MTDTVDALARILPEWEMAHGHHMDVSRNPSLISRERHFANYIAAALTAEGLSIVKTAEVERAYTLLVSATPALWRRFEDSPNDVAVYLNGVLNDAVVDWVQGYQRSAGRSIDEFPRALETP